MGFLEKQTDPTSPMHWRGDMQADYFYPSGIAGDKFFKHIMQSDTFLVDKCPKCNKLPSDEVFDGGYYCKDCDVYYMKKEIGKGVVDIWKKNIQCWDNMRKYRITRVWEIDAENIDDALQKTKNWNHINGRVEAIGSNGLTSKERRMKKIRKESEKLVTRYKYLGR